MMTLPVDAVPDITNNRVQIVTVSPTLAPQEVEQLITFPIEVAMSNIMNVQEIRSVSRFGLSVVTVVFKESVPILDARQLINEQIQTVAREIPSELGTPEMMPITTGLGEIYQYTLDVEPGYEKRYDAMELRTIQDWIVKRQLSGIPGIVEINSFGGYLKQYEVAVDPDALYSLNITIGDVFEALSRNNENTGGSYIEKVNRAYYIRSEGMISSLDDIRRIVVANRGGIPIHVSDVGTVKFGSANLMSLGAIDFGIVVDGSIVIVEGILAHLFVRQNLGRTLSRREMDEQIIAGAGNVVRSATFAVIIILIVFFPILTLTGIEGKYFTPMAKTLVFCIIGALLLSLTYVPMMSSLVLRRRISDRPTFADRFFAWLNRIYQRCLAFCLRFSWGTVAVAVAAFIGSLMLFTRLGAEFIPTLDEGDFAMQMTLPAGSSLTRSIAVSEQAEKILMENFPEIKHVVAKIGTAEVPTDPMAVEDADVMIVMKPFEEWTSASSRAELVEKMKAALDTIPDVEFNFSQPIQLRFNELMTGAKADIAIKLYGEDMAELYDKAREAARYVEQVPGASDVLVEQAMGLPQLVVKYNRAKIARYGINIEELNSIIRSAYAGETAGTVFENERRFDLVVRLDQRKVADLNLDRLFIRTSEGIQIPVSEVATIDLVNGPLQINRDATKRRVVIGVNVRDADIQQVVESIRQTLEQHVTLKPGYYFEYGGQFENLQNAIRTLLVVIPVALMLILLLLFFAFKSVTYSLVVFSTVPLSIIGGILALWLRGLPFSISAGVGFIALFGVAVLNGILMINHFNALRESTTHRLSTGRVIARGTQHLLRPVFLTGLVASLGFVPMAVATSAGAEVQRPLATVVIGGLFVSTLLTLFVVPVFYRLVGSAPLLLRRLLPVLMLPALMLLPLEGHSQQRVTLDEAVAMALENHPRLKSADAAVERTRAMRGESWELAPTTVDYSFGQLNGTERNDREISITQSFGSLLTPFYKNALVRRQTETGVHYRELVRREVVAEVKRAWSYYLYTQELCRLYADQNALAAELSRTSELRYQQGDITRLEQSMTATMAAEMRNRLFQAQEEQKVAAARLQWACYADAPLMPSDTLLTRFDAPKEISADQQRSYFQSQVREAEARTRVEKSRFFPELSFGYQRQNILPDKGLNAYVIGASFPIFFNTRRSRIRQAKADAYIARNDAALNLRNVDNRITELQANLRRYEESLRYYVESALPEAETLVRAARLQLANSETTIAEYIMSLNTALEIRRGYIETLNQYNITALEYELYR